MSRLKTRRNIRISNRAAMAAAILLGVSAVLGTTPQMERAWNGGDGVAGPANTIASAAAQPAPDRASPGHSSSRQRFSLGQLLFRHR